MLVVESIDPPPDSLFRDGFNAQLREADRIFRQLILPLRTLRPSACTVAQDQMLAENAWQRLCWENRTMISRTETSTDRASAWTPDNP